jgi:NADH-quinone oxidoreductase subunit J
VANLLFYVVSVAAVVAAVGVVAARNPIASVLALLATFFCLATIYLLAGYQFMAAAQLLVYAGAIMVLFLFVIMLLNLGGPETPAGLDVQAFTSRRMALPLAIAGALLGLGLIAVNRSGGLPTDPSLSERGVDSVDRLASALFGRFLLPFEASSVLLLATAVGVIVLAKRERKQPAREGRAEGAP